MKGVASLCDRSFLHLAKSGLNSDAVIRKLALVIPVDWVSA